MASQDYYTNMSHILSRVMDDIGVNKKGVLSRRRTFLISENLMTLHNYLLQKNETRYIFGSQTEGATTVGLRSDVDTLTIEENFNLIQDPNDSVPSRTNFLMIPGQFPGYCKLQLLKSNRPFPEDVLPSDGYTFDEAGRVLLLHKFHEDGLERHGPAEQVDDEGLSSNDFVTAIRCKTWPKGYKMWSRHQRKGTWPTPEMINYMENSGCFVVQVAHRLDEKKSESWRISTSLAERCLMFSLNITQIRCHILIKMIVKTFIDPVIPDVISSYICKNLLFHCVENTRQEFWQDSNLLRCVNQILLIMLESIRCMNCPNYFNESINLLLGKVNKDNQPVLMDVILKLLVSDFVREIRYDNINELIHNHRATIYQRKDCSHDEKCKNNPFFENLTQLYFLLGKQIQSLMLDGRFSQRDWIHVDNTMLLFALQGPLQYESATSLYPFLCSHLASLKASERISPGEMVSGKASWLYERSFDSDATSSRLKYASYLYCAGQLMSAINILTVQIRHEAGNIVLCGCDVRNVGKPIHTNIDPSLSVLRLSSSNVSMCVMFSQAERQCCPRELQYEMYRSTEQEKLQRDEYGHSRWMDLACISSISYRNFLLYMALRRLGFRPQSLQTLEQLTKLTSVEVFHRETMYNLLGQCYEYENRFEEAFACYCKSLRERPTNNAARWHIALLLNTVYQNK